MTVYRVGPKEANPTHDVLLISDNSQMALLLENGIRGMQEISQTPSTMLVGGGAKKWGTGDPTFTEIEQASWIGGRGQEFFTDDNTKYLDAWQAMGRVPGKLIPQLQWKFAKGHRSLDQNIPGDMSWHALRSTERYISVAFEASASYSADLALIWLRKRGSPGTLTLELCADSTGDPGAAAKTVTKTIADVPDTLSVVQTFDWTTTSALTSGTTYHLKVYGAAADTAANHWEVGVNEAGSASKYSSDNSTWNAASYSLYYRVVDADTASMSGRFHIFQLNNTTMYMITQPATGDSALYAWNETTDVWAAQGMDAGDSLSGIVKSVAVSKNIAHCARGTGASDETIWTFNSVSGTETGQDDTAAGNKADLVLAYNDADDGPKIGRFENDNCYFSSSEVKALNTNLAFGTDVKFPEGYLGLSMVFYNGQPYVRTTNGLYSIKTARPDELPVGLGSIVEKDTALAPMLAKDLFLYLGWGPSVERLYGGTLDDLGPWKGAGMPNGRQGYPSAMCAGLGCTYIALDGGTTNYSCVLSFDGIAFEEVFRGWAIGQRIRSLYYQSENVGTSPARLWIGCGESLVYIEQPDQSLNPLNDSDSVYNHEFAVVSSVHDFGATHYPKLFKALEVSADNLGSVCNVGVDYQVDGDIGGSVWTELSTLYESPHDIAEFNLGNRKKIRYRLRCNTSDASTPPIVNAVVVTGFARTKLKRQWNLRIRSSDLQRTRSGGKDAGWREVYDWLNDAAKSAAAVLMHTNDSTTDSVYVVVEPPSVFRKFANTIQHWLGGVFAVTLREA